MVVRYIMPEQWIQYDGRTLVNELTDAKAAILSLASMPYQRAWAETLQDLELKREVAGTSKIEGADFTERELEIALKEETPEATLTRSQRQARAAQQTYRWIAKLSGDQPIDEELICQVHRRIVTGCDDDHCEPGAIRKADENVTFGSPRHRGVEGGRDCAEAFAGLCAAIRGEFRDHDPLIQALALHYHIGAMHPFQDGNGRTARALEALTLQRARMKDDLFVAMSNYYYDEKQMYLRALSEVRADNDDLTSFLRFGLKGIASQCQRLLAEIRMQVSKSLFRDVMGQMFHRLRSTRKRVMAERQLHILDLLLERDSLKLDDLAISIYQHYADLKAPGKAMIRDLDYLLQLGAVSLKTENHRSVIAIRLEWATEVTETSFYEQMRKLPEARSHLVLTPPR